MRTVLSAVTIFSLQISLNSSSLAASWNMTLPHMLDLYCPKENPTFKAFKHHLATCTKSNTNTSGFSSPSPSTDTIQSDCDLHECLNRLRQEMTSVTILRNVLLVFCHKAPADSEEGRAEGRGDDDNGTGIVANLIRCLAGFDGTSGISSGDPG